MKIYIHVTESVNLAHTLCWRDICCVTALLFVRPSVCMSVCLSQAGIVSKRLEGSSWFLACRLPSTCPTLFCEEVRIPTKKKGTSLWNFLQTADYENFATASRSCCQQNSSMVELVDDTYTTVDESWLFTTCRSSVTL